MLFFFLFLHVKKLILKKIGPHSKGVTSWTSSRYCVWKDEEHWFIFSLLALCLFTDYWLDMKIDQVRGCHVHVLLSFNTL